MKVRREFQLACRACHAPAGRPCKGKQGEILHGVHFQRAAAIRSASHAAVSALYAPLRATALLAFLLLLPLCSTRSYAKDRPALQTAKVLSQDLDSYNAGTAVMPAFGGLVGFPITRRSNTVVVETSQQRMTWSEIGKKTIILPVGGTVFFYQDRNDFVVIDAGHKKHRFALMHMEMIAK